MGKTPQDIDLLKIGIKHYSNVRNLKITACGIMVLGSGCSIYNICNAAEPKDLSLYAFLSGACILGSVMNGITAYIDNVIVKKLKKELKDNS